MDYIDKILNPGDADLPLASRLLYQLIDEKYRALLDESSDLMCIVDRDGKFIYVNRQLVESLGYTKKEILQMHMYDIVAHESLRPFTEKTREFLKTGRMRIPDFVLKTKKGAKILGELSSVAFCDNEGRYCGAKAVFMDRTKLIEIQKLEQKYESMLEDGIDTLDHIIMILDRDLKVRWASSSVGKYFGMDKIGIVGRGVREIFEENLKNILLEEEAFLTGFFSAYETRGAIESLEFRLKKPGSGEEITIEHWSYPISHGELNGGRIEIFRDITARKRSEEALEYYYKKIHTIMERAVEGIVELRTDNTVEFVNMSFLAKTGYSETEILERSFYDFILPDEHKRLVAIKLIRKAGEVTFIRKDGSYLYALVSSIPLVFGTHSPHTLCFISDITQEKLATLKLRDANMTLRALNDSLLDNALRDVSTGVYNARYLNERLIEEARRARRYFRPFSVVMIDLDFFKAVNDTYGHLFGDVVLRSFADLLKRCVRATDVVVRCGGDEFVVFCPDTDINGAQAVAHKIAQAMSRTKFGDGERSIEMTASRGIASYPESGVLDPVALLDAADQAMYQSKSRGRNCVTVFDKGGMLVSSGTSVSEPLEDEFERTRKRLRFVNARNEEAVLESLKPLSYQMDEAIGYGAGYTQRVVADIEVMGVCLSLGEPEAQRAKRAAFLSNLGFLFFPREILKKPALNERERTLIHDHPVVSAELVKDIAFLETVREDILSHHERFDGGGYPKGAKGRDIPFAARMVAVAEAYEAMIVPRPYRPRALDRKEAACILKKESGRQFDPLLVDCFLHHIE